MHHVERAIEKQKQPLLGDQPQAQGGEQPQQAPPPQQPPPQQEPEHHHGKDLGKGLGKAGEFGFGATLGSQAANAALGAFKG